MLLFTRCLACLRPQPTKLLQQRTFSALSTTTIPRPSLLPSTLFRPTLPNADITTTLTSSSIPSTITGSNLLQLRGAKRDTFNPSHVVRKRRHGFLSRLRTRTGRMVLKRRRAKGRNTLSH